MKIKLFILLFVFLLLSSCSKSKTETYPQIKTAENYLGITVTDCSFEQYNADYTVIRLSVKQEGEFKIERAGKETEGMVFWDCLVKKKEGEKWLEGAVLESIRMKETADDYQALDFLKANDTTVVTCKTFAGHSIVPQKGETYHLSITIAMPYEGWKTMSNEKNIPPDIGMVEVDLIY